MAISVRQGHLYCTKTQYNLLIFNLSIHKFTSVEKQPAISFIIMSTHWY